MSELELLNHIYQGDVLKVLKTLPDECVDCCITSPPYYGLRDYSTGKWIGGDPNCEHWTPDNDIKNASDVQRGNFGSLRKEKHICRRCGAVREDLQIGLEQTPEEYVAKLVEVFKEVKRVLKKEGTFWLNIGDTYFGGGGGNQYSQENQGITAQQFRANGEKEKSAGISYGFRNQKRPDIKKGDMIGIPWMLAFALRRDGWFLRQDIIWHKKNCMPESVTNRCTKSHEYIFLFAKSSKYFYDNEAIKEPVAQSSIMRCNRVIANNEHFDPTKHKNYEGIQNPMDILIRTSQSVLKNMTRNKRDVWSISPHPFKGNHFATFPENLITPMILAGTSKKGVCSICGLPFTRITKQRIIKKGAGLKHLVGESAKATGNRYDVPYNILQTETQKWIPTCKCESPTPKPAVVLDCFMGAGTTGAVAKKLGRNYIGIDLNPEYIKIANERISKVKRIIDLTDYEV